MEAAGCITRPLESLWVASGGHLATSIGFLEVSGGLGPESVAAYAKTGVDYLSLGALTHSAPASDISLRLDADWTA